MDTNPVEVVTKFAGRPVGFIPILYKRTRMSAPPKPIGIPFNNSQSSGYSFTDNDIAALGFTPCATAPPGTPEPPDGNFWIVAGTKVADYITLWIYKKLGWLIIIGSIEQE